MKHVAPRRGRPCLSFTYAWLVLMGHVASLGSAMSLFAPDRVSVDGERRIPPGSAASLIYNWHTQGAGVDSACRSVDYVSICTRPCQC